MARKVPPGYFTDVGEEISGIIHKPLGGEARDDTDHSRLRQSRERHEGFHIGKYLQPPAMIFTRDGHSIYMGDMYKGASAFLICGGPSFKNVDKEKLKQPGIVTMCVNNSVASFRPNIWTCVDDPGNFIKSTWLDPAIMKFVPFCHTEKTLFDNEKWKDSKVKVGDCPNVWYFRRNEHFKAEQFLFEDTFNWGNHKSFGGGRSVMLVAVRLMFYLGIRKLYLLGVDFNMDGKNKYHFEQDRSKSSQNNNMNTYKLLVQRYTQLKPIFDDHGFEVFNCNPDSALKVFPFKDFDEAVADATAMLPDVTTERTEGLYDRRAKIKEAAKKEKKNKVEYVPTNASDEEKKVIKEQLDQARGDLDIVKEERDVLHGLLQHPDADVKDISDQITEVEKRVVEQRKKFRKIERKKNIIWYGQHPAPKR